MTPDEAFAAVHNRQGKLTLEEFSRLLRIAGRLNGPALLFDAWYSARIDVETLRARVGGVWSDAEYPDRNLDQESWRDLFHSADFTIDGRAADRPSEPVRLWRGSVPERRTDWSWTADRKVAERYASGSHAGRPASEVWEVLAPPAALLCANTERGEAEYVVDTDGLTIRRAA